jgi:hypothetical protein
VTDGYLLSFPGLADFQISRDGGEVAPSLSTPLDEETIRHLLLDQVLPRVVTHRGRPVLHAAGVVVGSSAVALLGDTGSGKSTLTASFASFGHVTLSDDALVLDSAGSEVIASPTYPSLRLWPDSLEQVFAERPNVAPMAHYSTKRRVVTPVGDPPTERAAPLRCICILGDAANENHSIVIEPLTVQEATIAIIRNTFQLDVGDRHRAASLFEAAATIAEQVPAFVLRYPRDYDRLGDVRRAIEEHVAALG